jgi:hypothetical protein
MQKRLGAHEAACGTTYHHRSYKQNELKLICSSPRDWVQQERKYLVHAKKILQEECSNY